MGLTALRMGKQLLAQKDHQKICADYKKLNCGNEGRNLCRKGFVPVIVGREEEEEEREKIMIPMKLMKHPIIVSLLESSALELGYDQPGTLRIIQCDVQAFKSMLDSISRRRR